MFLIVGDLRLPESRSILSLVKRIRAAGDLACLYAADADSAAGMTQEGSGTIFLAGLLSPSELVHLCMVLQEKGRQVILLFDALEVTGSRDMTFSQLDESGFQFLRVEAAQSLARSRHTYVYPYAKAETAASVVAICARTKRVLLIQRGCEPFLGYHALPGGFLRPLLETLEECAVRELAEETGLNVSPQELKLVAVRSNIHRDNRGHVIEHCYMFIAADGIDQARLQSGDDAQALRLVPFAEALAMNMAADHAGLVREALHDYARQNNVLTYWWQQVERLLGNRRQQRTA